MILFIAPNPHKIEEREGFLQRVRAIDSLFPSEEKIYFDDLHEEIDQAKAVMEARVIYVHSIYNANKILKIYSRFSEKIITDLHGVVPEEEEYANNMEMVSIMKVTEEEVFKVGRNFVAVTNSMVRHFDKKYPTNERIWIVLPIFENIAISKGVQTKNTGKRVVIYAGGTQPWQNISDMKEAIKQKEAKYNFVILTHNKKEFSDLSGQQNITVKTVPSADIANYYKEASLGFVLRKKNLVNRVACPTKLVEYLAYGVLPIVSFESIGDFNEMGYSFIRLDDFIKQDLSESDINKGVENNFRVYETLIMQVEAAREKLIDLVNSIKQTQSNHTLELIALEIQYQRDINQILRYEYQIEQYKAKINEYAKSVEYYKEIAENKHSKITIFKKGLLKR